MSLSSGGEGREGRGGLFLEQLQVHSHLQLKQREHQKGALQRVFPLSSTFSSISPLRSSSISGSSIVKSKVSSLPFLALKNLRSSLLLLAVGKLMTIPFKRMMAKIGRTLESMIGRLQFSSPVS